MQVEMGVLAIQEQNKFISDEKVLQVLIWMVDLAVQDLLDVVVTILAEEDIETANKNKELFIKEELN